MAGLAPAAPLLLRLVPANNKKSSEPVLRVEHLQAGTLPPLTFEVAAGECLAIEGPSGAGKTLLLRAIADLDPAPGQVFLNGAERNEMPGYEWRRHVRYCAAEPAWWTDTPRAALRTHRRTASTVSCIRSGLSHTCSTARSRRSPPASASD